MALPLSGQSVASLAQIDCDMRLMPTQLFHTTHILIWRHTLLFSVSGRLGHRIL